MDSFERMFNDINRLAAAKGLPKANRVWSHYGAYDCHFDRNRYFVEEHLYGSERVEMYIVAEEQIGWSNQWREWSRVKVPLNFDINNWTNYVSNNRKKRDFNWKKIYLYKEQ